MVRTAAVHLLPSAFPHELARPARVICNDKGILAIVKAATLDVDVIFKHIRNGLIDLTTYLWGILRREKLLDCTLKHQP